VCTDDGVNGSDWFTADKTSAALRVSSLLRGYITVSHSHIENLNRKPTGVNGIQSVKSLLELRREPPVCDSLVREQCVTSSTGAIQHVQKCRPGRLLFISDIAVPGYGVSTLLEKVARSGVFGTAVNKMDLRVSGRRARCGVYVVTTKVFYKVKSLLDGKIGEVLVPERFASLV
jgi:hypothetical protein